MAAGRRHLLVGYRHTMRRLSGRTLLLGLGLFALWHYKDAFTTYYRPELDFLIFFAAAYATGLGLFAWMAQRMGYVRAFDDYLLVASPFFRFKTSYQRILGIQSKDFHRMFDLEKLSWAEERYTEPLVGSTAVVVQLTDFPVQPVFVNLFCARYLLSLKEKAFVFVVPDWMAFSVELDSRTNDFRQRRRRRPQPVGFQRGSSR